MSYDTIAAIATPPGMGGIGIIRISGPRALMLITRIFGRTPHGVGKEDALVSHKVYHGYIFHPENTQLLDEVLMIPMQAPRSYTREDVVEVHAHAGPMVMRAILACIITAGARLAEPGEFTRRAFLNGRIDLTQAEAVCDMITAKSTTAVNMAAAQATGKLKKTISRGRDQLIQLLTLLEAAIDFPDEGDALIPEIQLMETITQVLDICTHGIADHENGHFLRDGIKLTICGPPNVGKSSLMNCLVESERSIVTAIPGTTRDLIEEALNIDGVPFVVTDTAGMHETEDPVEQIGIKRAKEHIARADIILFMKTAGDAVSVEEVEAIAHHHGKLILVFNKTDLVSPNWTPQLPEPLCRFPHALISARVETGITALKKQIMEISEADITSPDSVVPNLRHKIALENAAGTLRKARLAISRQREEETLAIDIRSAADSLGEITGDTADIDILDNIFSQFCIGK